MTWFGALISLAFASTIIGGMIFEKPPVLLFIWVFVICMGAAWVCACGWWGLAWYAGFVIFLGLCLEDFANQVGPRG